MLLLVLLAAAFVLSAAMTYALRLYALKVDLLDVPNARSSHDRPTPRGGGVAVVAVVLVTGLWFWFTAELKAGMAAGLLGGGALVAAVGYLDDHADVPARWRLAAHITAAVWVVAWTSPLPPLPLPGVELPLGWVGAVLAVPAIVWVLNLYNFVDGIDGIAGVEAVTVAATGGALLWWGDSAGLAMVCATVASASLGFLIWNWPPAKIFMGDVGSGFLGFLFGALAVVGFAEGALPPWVWLILLGAFIVDATWTLVRRILRGERFYEAHRSHAYQRAARHYGSHLPVTVAVGAINLVWLAPLAWVAAAWPQWGIVLLAVAWMPLMLLCLYFRAGMPE